jgi:hypothetical protein
LQLDGLFETLIGDPGNHSREPPVHLPDGGRVPSGPGSIPFDHQGAPRRRQALPALVRHAGLIHVGQLR